MTYSGCARPFPPYAWSQGDYDALRAGADQIGCRAEDLLVIMYNETARTLAPGIAFCNDSGYPSAIGLIQFTPKANAAIGVDEQGRLAFMGLTVAQQMPYVVKFFLSVHGGKRFTSPPDAATLYQYVAAPSTVGKEVLYTQAEVPCSKPTKTKDPYCANIGLDMPPRDGVITKSDLAAKLAAIALEPRCQAALAALAASKPSTTFPPVEEPSQDSAGKPTPWGLYAAILGVGGFALWLKSRPSRP